MNRGYGTVGYHRAMKYASWWMDQVGFVGIERTLASPLCLPSLPDCGAVYLPDCGASPGTQSALCRTGRALARDSLRHVDHGSCVRMRMAWRRPRLVNDRPPFHQRPREECGDQRGKMRLAVHRRLRRLLRPRLPPRRRRPRRPLRPPRPRRLRLCRLRRQLRRRRLHHPRSFL